MSGAIQAQGQALLLYQEGNRQLGAALARAPLHVARTFSRLFKRSNQPKMDPDERRWRRQIARELGDSTDGELLELGFGRADLPLIRNGTYRR